MGYIFFFSRQHTHSSVKTYGCRVKNLEKEEYILFKRNGVIVLICSFFLLITTACSSESVVEEYPEKSIQLVVSFSPGAATDTQARIISKYANKYLGEELVIVNKPGGGGQVGWNSFASTESDGYTLAVYNLPHIITQPLLG